MYLFELQAFLIAIDCQQLVSAFWNNISHTSIDLVFNVAHSEPFNENNCARVLWKFAIIHK